MQSDQRVPFVVLSTQRSGSTWVIDVLNKLDGTKVYGELLLKRDRAWDAGEWDFPRFVESDHHRSGRRPSSMFAYLDDLYGQAPTVGFKLMYSQLRHYPEVLAYIRMRKVRIIHLLRRNYIDIHVSQAFKSASKRPHVWKGSDVVRTNDGPVELKPVEEEKEIRQVRLNPAALLRQLRWYRRKQAFFRKWLSLTSRDHIEVAYEDLVADQSCFEQISDFLGISAGNEIPQTDMVRIRKGSHPEVISNYDEVQAVLRDTPFEQLLQEA